MSYVEYDYYVKTFKGEPVNDADFPFLLMRAEEIIEEMTRYRLTPVSFLAMPEWTQNKVKAAVCAEIEYLDAGGGADMDIGLDLQSASLGKFNYSRAASDAGGGSAQSLYAPRAIRLLAPTGLLYRGGGV